MHAAKKQFSPYYIYNIQALLRARTFYATKHISTTHEILHYMHLTIRSIIQHATQQTTSIAKHANSQYYF